MNYYDLGQTGLRVSELCFGALPLGPLQKNLSIEEGGRLILKAFNDGINFIDTAEVYGTHGHIRWALERFKGPVVIATKSPATTYEQMKTAVKKCLAELGVSQIDIFHLHAARDSQPFVNREGALNALLEYKAAGVIKAVGISTHSAVAAKMAAHNDRIDILFPLININGLGILEGGVPEMISAIQLAQANGKGIYAMKALGGGTMIDNLEEKLEFVRIKAGVPVIAVGMVREVELEMNLALFEGRAISEELRMKAGNHQKTAKVIESLCKGCGHCVEICHSDALSLIDGKGFIDISKCLMCGYCSRECPEFAIRVI